MKAVLQAGGLGTRLRPFTFVIPKPLVPFGELPIIEILCQWLRRNGIDELIISTGYLGHLVQSVCGDGSQWDIRIRYVHEEKALGTVGALNLIADSWLSEPFFLLNGDILTDLDLNALMSSHKENGGIATIACHTTEVKLEYGVIETEGDLLTGFREKPAMNYTVSMGVYAFDPSIVRHIPRGVAFGFDDLMYALLRAQQPVHVYRHDGIWLDIGRPEDYQKAQESFSSYRSRILGV